MKKILLFVILASMSSGLFAQLSKGAIALTGTFGLGGNKQKNEQTPPSGTTITTTDQKTKQFLFLPAIGYFVTDKIEAGIVVGIQRNTTINKYQPPSATSEIKNENPLNGGGLYGNYYFISQEKFYMYGGIQLLMAGGTGKVTTSFYNGPTTIVETKNKMSSFGLNSGFLYFIKPNLALNGTVGLLAFNSVKTESTNSGTTTKTHNNNWAFGVNGLLINIGVKAFFGKGE